MKRYGERYLCVEEVVVKGGARVNSEGSVIGREGHRNCQIEKASSIGNNGSFILTIIMRAVLLQLSSKGHNQRLVSTIVSHAASPSSDDEPHHTRQVIIWEQ